MTDSYNINLFRSWRAALVETQQPMVLPMPLEIPDIGSVMGIVSGFYNLNREGQLVEGVIVKIDSKNSQLESDFAEKVGIITRNGLEALLWFGPNENAPVLLALQGNSEE